MPPFLSFLFVLLNFLFNFIAKYTTMRLGEALRFANLDKKVLKKDLAKLLWNNSSENAQMVNISKLISGKTTRIDPLWVPIICKFCGVDANFLFKQE